MKKENVCISGSLELKKRLPRGAIKALANKYNFSLVWITSVITGRAKGDPRILADACRMAEIEDHKRLQLAQVMQDETVTTQ